MTTIPSINSLNSQLGSARKLNQELLTFILAGEPGASETERFIPLPEPSGLSFTYPDTNDSGSASEPVRVSVAELLNLAHARSIPRTIASILSEAFEYGEDAPKRIYSLQLAQKLPKGHPYRFANGLWDTADELVSWLLDDPDLDSGNKSFLLGILGESDDLKRADKWPELIKFVQQSGFAWADWRDAFDIALAGYVMPFDAFLYELHPREAGVIRAAVSGMTFAEIADRFGVDEDWIIRIYAEGLEKVRKAHEGVIARLQLAIETRKVSTLTELAAVLRDASYKNSFFFTKLMLRLCSGRSVKSSGETEYVLSEHAHSSADQL